MLSFWECIVSLATLHCAASTHVVFCVSSTTSAFQELQTSQAWAEHHGRTLAETVQVMEQVLESYYKDRDPPQAADKQAVAEAGCWIACPTKDTHGGE